MQIRRFKLYWKDGRVTDWRAEAITTFLLWLSACGFAHELLRWEEVNG